MPNVQTATLRIATDFRWRDTVTVRKARKAHRCEMPRENRGRWPDRADTFRGWDGGPLPEGHTPTIDTGEQYVEDFGEAPPFQAGARYCASCAIAAGIATDRTP